MSCLCRHTRGILPLRRLKQEDHMFEASLNYSVSCCKILSNAHKETASSDKVWCLGDSVLFHQLVLLVFAIEP